MITSSSFPLTYTRLRFRCQAETFLNLGGLRAGSNLRGALLEVMHRSTCDGNLSDPAHAALCPVCWLTTTRERPGRERRGYVLTPPFSNAEYLTSGEVFEFHITLFGEAIRYLPYFVLAVPEVGRYGVGIGRGRFLLISISAEHPLDPDLAVLKAGENIVQAPEKPVNHEDILSASIKLAERLKSRENLLCIEYRTPLRLIVDNQLLKTLEYGAFFSHLLMRLDDLAVQYAKAPPRPADDRHRLLNLAKQVRLVRSQTRWVEVSSGSSRTGRSTWISGLEGSASYSASSGVWQELLPWILWGQIAQVGKDTAKGNGCFGIDSDVNTEIDNLQQPRSPRRE